MDFTQEELIALAQHDMEQGRMEGALHKLKQVVQQETAPAFGLALAAKLYAQLRLFPSAKALYERYLALDPHSPEIAFELGMVHFDMGDTEAALAIWHRLLDTVPNFPPALFYAALALSRSQRLADAKRHLDVLLQTAAEDNLYFGRGKELLQEIDAQATQQYAQATAANVSVG